jgi:hypothetical protein
MVYFRDSVQKGLTELARCERRLPPKVLTSTLTRSNARMFDSVWANPVDTVRSVLLGNRPMGLVLVRTSYGECCLNERMICSQCESMGLECAIELLACGARVGAVFQPEIVLGDYYENHESLLEIFVSRGFMIDESIFSTRVGELVRKLLREEIQPREVIRCLCLGFPVDELLASLRGERFGT